jgi:hypothetical protein
MVAEAKGRVENLTAEVDGADVTLIDIREDDEHVQNGVIPRCGTSPEGMLKFGTDPTSAYHREEFDLARRTILNCASRSVGRSPPTPFRGWATGTSPTSMAASRLGNPAEEI